MRKTAPWPVDWIDTSEAIARRALSLAKPEIPPEAGEDVAIFTSGKPDEALVRLVRGFGLTART
jgi:glutamate racemase